MGEGWREMARDGERWREVGRDGEIWRDIQPAHSSGPPTASHQALSLPSVRGAGTRCVLREPKLLMAHLERAVPPGKPACQQKQFPTTRHTERQPSEEKVVKMSTLYASSTVHASCERKNDASLVFCMHLGPGRGSGSLRAGPLSLA